MLSQTQDCNAQINVWAQSELLTENNRVLNIFVIQHDIQHGIQHCIQSTVLVDAKMTTSFWTLKAQNMSDEIFIPDNLWQFDFFEWFIIIVWNIYVRQSLNV